MIRRVMRDGWSVKYSQAEAEKVGIRHVPHMLKFANDYIEHNKKK